MSDIIERVSDKLKIPRWWVKAIAIEYTECRDYVTRDKIWTFNFNKITQEELEKAVSEHKVILHDFLFHNVHPAVLQNRMIDRMAGGVTVPLAEHSADVIPEGLVSKHYIPFQANPINVEDPKLGFSTHCQVFDNGHLYQWEIAKFVHVEGRRYGKFTSDYVNLEPFEEMQSKLRDLMNNFVKPSEIGHEGYKARVEAYYKQLDDIRRPILKELLQVHHKKLASVGEHSKVPKYQPSILSHFERFTVKNNDIQTKLYAEPIFYRGCWYHAKRAEKLYSSLRKDHETVDKLDLVYQERATAIILGVACFEAFINGLGFDNYPEIWKHIEQISIMKKCSIYFELSGKDSSLFNTGIEPYLSLKELIKKRDELIHFKRKYHPISHEISGVKTHIEKLLPHEFIRIFPEKLKESIERFCRDNDLNVPNWLVPQPNLQWMEFMGK